MKHAPNTLIEQAQLCPLQNLFLTPASLLMRAVPPQISSKAAFFSFPQLLQASTKLRPFPQLG